jgi:uncharacterized protein
MRDAGNVTVPHDFEKMKAGLEREGGSFSVFGGEALLTPLPLLEEIFAYGLQRFGSNGIQTNGALITDVHVELFKRYKVNVGLSLDGPGELNDSRWAGSLKKTREATAQSFSGLFRLLDAGIVPSVIVTLYRGNAVGDKLTQLLEWFRLLEVYGVYAVRLHLLEVETDEVQQAMALTIEENTAALLRLYEFQATTKVRFDLFGEMAKLLLGNDVGATCVWGACDPYTTAAVRGVDAEGESSNCGRTNKEGISWQKAQTPGYERQVALYHTPQADFGCEDCRFFFACKGQCPGTAEGGDWRNRSEHCGAWMTLFDRIEADLISIGHVPLSRNDALRTQVDALMLKYWARGENLSITQAVAAVQAGVEPTIVPPARGHGDHWDAPDGYRHADGDFTIHGDRGTTDMHGDSDAKNPR